MIQGLVTVVIYLWKCNWFIWHTV